jgi:hypothetical protein
MAVFITFERFKVIHRPIRFKKFLVAKIMNSAALWEITPCSLTEIY